MNVNPVAHIALFKTVIAQKRSLPHETEELNTGIDRIAQSVSAVGYCTAKVWLKYWAVQ